MWGIKSKPDWFNAGPDQSPIIGQNQLILDILIIVNPKLMI
jgi:hypothetical protein